MTSRETDVKKLISIPENCIDASNRLSGYVHDMARMKPAQRDKQLVQLVRQGQAEYIHAILKVRDLVDVNLKNGALFTAALKSGHEDVIDVLLHHGADVNALPDKAVVKHIRNDNRDAEVRVRIMRQMVKAGYDLSERTDNVIMPMFKNYFNRSYWCPAEEMLPDFFDLGADYTKIKRACLNAKQEKWANDLEKYYKEYQSRYGLIQPPGAEDEMCHEMVEMSAEPPAKTPSTEKEEKLAITPWQLLETGSIALVEKIEATDTTIQTVFNFQARSVTSIVQVAQTTPNVQIRNFHDLESHAQLMTAFNKLIEAGGKADVPEPAELSQETTPEVVKNTGIRLQIGKVQS